MTSNSTRLNSARTISNKRTRARGEALASAVCFTELQLGSSTVGLGRSSAKHLIPAQQQTKHAAQ